MLSIISVLQMLPEDKHTPKSFFIHVGSPYPVTNLSWNVRGQPVSSTRRFRVGIPASEFPVESDEALTAYILHWTSFLFKSLPSCLCSGIDLQETQYINHYYVASIQSNPVQFINSDSYSNISWAQISPSTFRSESFKYGSLKYFCPWSDTFYTYSIQKKKTPC